MSNWAKAVLRKNHVAHKTKTIDEKVADKDDRDGRRGTNEEKWKAVKRCMAKGRPATLILIHGHPVALRHVVPDEMQN